MKKVHIFVLVLVLVLALVMSLSLVACGGDESLDNEVEPDVIINPVGEALAFLRAEDLVLYTGPIPVGEGVDAPYQIMFQSDYLDGVDENILAIADYASWLSQVGGWKDDQIDITWGEVPSQKIVIIDRGGLPFMWGEVTFNKAGPSLETISIIDKADIRTGFSQEFSLNWNLFQAVCLGMSWQIDVSPRDLNIDAECNILAANAAAGMSGFSEEEARDMIDSLGYTSLSETAQRNLEFRFIEKFYLALYRERQ